MSIESRIALYQKIEELRGCPLISYVTSTRHNAQGEMASDAIAEILDQILALPPDCNQVDLLVVSLGGDPTVAWRIMSLLRDRVQKVGVLIPQAAFSAATLLALGADEIVMHPCGNLGPVDPQIRVLKKADGNARPEVITFGSEDLAGFLSFVREHVGLSDQEYLRSAFELFCKEVGAIPIGVASRGARLSVSLGVKLLQMHMKDEAAKQKATAIAEALNKEFFHHGYPVGRKEAKEIGLKIIEPERTLETTMWELWQDLERELECRAPFNPMAEIEKSGKGAALFSPVPHLQLPANIPPQLAQQVIQQVIQNAIVHVDAIDYTQISGVIESVRRASAFRVRGKILARRDFEGKISTNSVVTSIKWEQVLPATV